VRVVHSDEPLVLESGPSLFLAGPTPRRHDGRSRRIDAVATLERLNYGGVVLVPERRDWAARFAYEDQVEWEYAGLQSATVIAFWVPRDLEALPGFPGAHSQGETLDELQENMREVIAMLLEDGEPALETEFVGVQTIRVS
jgi:hypothetical protein